MLKSLRKNTKVILWITVAAFTVTIFAGWGMHLTAHREDLSNAASVNGRVITRRAYERAMRREYINVLDRKHRIYASEHNQEPEGDDLTKLQEEAREIAQETTLENLISSELLFQEARRQQIEISPQTIVAELKREPVFQTDGKFDTQKYNRIVADKRIDWAGIEDEIRSSLIISRLMARVMDPVKISAKEAEDYWLSRGLEREKYAQNIKSYQDIALYRKQQIVYDQWYEDLKSKAKIKIYLNQKSQDRGRISGDREIGE